MSVPIPPPNVPIARRQNSGDLLCDPDWYSFLRDFKSSSDNGDLPSGFGVSGATLDAIQTAVAMAVGRNGSSRHSNAETPVGVMTAQQWRGMSGLMEAPVIQAQPRITQPGNGVWLIQSDTAANIANYPASLYNPGLYLASDTFGIYRSDGTGWTQLAFISDAVYGAGWNGVANLAPSQNAVYDQFVIVLAAIAAIAAGYDALFDHFADAGNVAATGETDLYSDTLAAGQLGTNGAKALAEYAGLFVLSATATRQVRVYFGGSLVFDSGTLSITGANAFWNICLTVIRESSSVVRCSTTMSTSSAALVSYTQYQRITGLTLANAQTVKITGQAAGVGAADNDIVAKAGYVEYKPAA